jgi:hypothetical protein
VVPNPHGPVCRATDENSGVKGIPLDGVNGHVVPLIGFQVLPAVSFGALVDFTLLCAHNEKVLVVNVKVEAAATCQA